MANLFHQILYRPLFNALAFLYQYVSFHDLGIAIILLTIIIRLILFPLFFKGAKDQAIMQRLAPKIKEIQDHHKNDKQKQAQALMDLYREHKVSPFSGFLLLLVQLPVLIALYQVFLKGLSANISGDLYSFVHFSGFSSNLFLGLVDLRKTNLLIALIAAAAQYFQGKLAMVKSNKPFSELSSMERMSRQMLYLGPIMTFVFLYLLNLPSAVGLYWLTTSAFSVIQQILINKKIAKHFDGTDAKQN